MFHDVKAAAYYADAVKWARENSIVNGTGKETFGPDANMIRAALWAAPRSRRDVDGGSPWYQKSTGVGKDRGHFRRHESERQHHAAGACHHAFTATPESRPCPVSFPRSPTRLQSHPGRLTQ